MCKEVVTLKLEDFFLFVGIVTALHGIKTVGIISIGTLTFIEIVKSSLVLIKSSVIIRFCASNRLLFVYRKQKQTTFKQTFVRRE